MSTILVAFGRLTTSAGCYPCPEAPTSVEGRLIVHESRTENRAASLQLVSGMSNVYYLVRACAETNNANGTVKGLWSNVNNSKTVGKQISESHGCNCILRQDKPIAVTTIAAARQLLSTD
ncbi:hypothetical protein ZHAS_00012898 [Anopheles sinensis]|uniref:Uncharacterized protein n=1 Tax=Anopheles sinensis TaxID=74873 RepID=A0A084W4C6_ANOSI|nr:hypothetical protein ZHAS_00012898 [Anopheles sinensis]